MADTSTAACRLRLSPAGHLHALEGAAAEGSPALRRVSEAFSRGEEEGLFELAAHPSAGLSPELLWWREFAARHLTERCHSPVGQAVLEPIEPLSETELAQLLSSAPPMEGAEYLDAAVLAVLWIRLDGWLRGEAAAAGGLEAFLSARAPLWRQVGRVCFHLAENKRDPDYPFAFIATYAPRADAEKIRYQPLSRALQEFAGRGTAGP